MASMDKDARESTFDVVIVEAVCRAIAHLRIVSAANAVLLNFRKELHAPVVHG